MSEEIEAKVRRLESELNALSGRVKILEFLLGQWVRKHERVYVAGGWDYDKEGVAMLDASKVLLKETTP